MCNLYTTFPKPEFLNIGFFWDEMHYVLLYSKYLPVDMTVPPQNTWLCKYNFTRASTGKKFVNRTACIDWLNTLRCVCKTAEICPSVCTYIRVETVGQNVEPIFIILKNVKHLNFASPIQTVFMQDH